MGTALCNMKIWFLVAVLALAIVAVQGKRPGKPNKPDKPGKKCKGECQLSGTFCNGTAKAYGCEDGEECCMTNKKPGMLYKPDKVCKGDCQMSGAACNNGTLGPYGCG